MRPIETSVFVAALLAAAPAFAVPPSHLAPQAPLNCDPLAKDNDNARTVRIQGKSKDAISVAKVILGKHPDDFRATYTLGLATIDANAGPTAFADGMTLLKHAADLLEKNYAACGAAKGWFSIYNTLGAEYLNAGDYQNAQIYLQKGIAHADSLEPRSRQRLYSNLAYIAYGQNDLNGARNYYLKAQNAGDATAAAKLRAIDIIHGTGK